MSHPNHGFLKSAVTGPNVWGGRLSFSASGGAGTTQQAVITDSSFHSRIIRASNHIILMAQNSTARGLNKWFAAAVSRVDVPIATMSNNASILVTYTATGAPAATASFYFMVFGGGTNT